MRANHLLLGLILGVIAVILFGASLPMTRLAVLALDPFFVTAARGAGAGLVAAVVLILLRRPIPWPDLRALAMTSLCLVIGFPGLMAIAMTSVPSGHGGVILGLLPIATAVAAVFVASERPSLFFWAMSLTGALLVVLFSIPDGGLVPVPGHLLLFAGVAICGAGYALAGSLSRRMPGWEVISWAVVASLPVLLPATLLLWPEAPARAPWSAWAGLAYQVLVSQYFGFFLWNSALALGGIARIGQVQLLQPFATLALATILLSEPIELRTILFASAVVVVVALGLRARVGLRIADIAQTPAATSAERS
jgi:drug/metabolite transporter (DMT)-like permease